jgi:hypothetical protein
VEREANCVPIVDRKTRTMTIAVLSCSEEWHAHEFVPKCCQVGNSYIGPGKRDETRAPRTHGVANGVNSTLQLYKSQTIRYSCGEGEKLSGPNRIGSREAAKSIPGLQKPPACQNAISEVPQSSALSKGLHSARYKSRNISKEHRRSNRCSLTQVLA